jgi:hypothetical protein
MSTNQEPTSEVSAAETVADTSPPSVTITDVPEPKVSEAVKAIQFRKSFHVEWKNPDDGKIYSGQFTTKRATLGDMGQIALRKVQRTGGEWLGQHFDLIHEMIAHLVVTLVEAPAWWKPEEFFYDEPLRLVWRHVRTWEDSFRKRVVG